MNLIQQVENMDTHPPATTKRFIASCFHVLYHGRPISPFRPNYMHRSGIIRLSSEPQLNFYQQNCPWSPSLPEFAC